jgi:ribulose-phosphate 3-epimerase
LPDLDIEVDGGVNADTVYKCKRAGANVLVSASYLFGSKDKAKAIDVLKG